MIRVNGETFGGETFYNGEGIYKKATINPDRNTIEMIFQDNKDLGDLQVATTYIRSEKPEAKLELVMKYIPYSRMDREIHEQIFSLDIFAKIINSMKFDKVYALDPHSGVSVDLIDNLELIDINQYVNKAIADFKPDYLFFPDKGAMAKYPEMIAACNGTDGIEQIPFFYGNKVRDLQNKGRIIKYDIITDKLDVKGKKVLIVDDICCKGGTFIWAAQEMIRLGVSEIALYVSHCENSIFDGDIFKTGFISQVYTSNSLNMRIKVFE